MTKISDELLELIHRKLDGDDLSPDETALLKKALAIGSPARAVYDELRYVQDQLKSLPTDRYPDAALNELLRRTSRAPVAAERTVLRWALAAAAIVLLAVALWTIRPSAVPVPDYASGNPAMGDSEIDSSTDLDSAAAHQALADLQAVFRLTSNAIDRSTHVAFDDVVRDEVAPALRKIPIRFQSQQHKGGGGS